jgi:hypothetical protein
VKLSLIYSTFASSEVIEVKEVKEVKKLSQMLCAKRIGLYPTNILYNELLASLGFAALLAKNFLAA